MDKLDKEEKQLLEAILAEMKNQNRQLSKVNDQLETLIAQAGLFH